MLSSEKASTTPALLHIIRRSDLTGECWLWEGAATDGYGQLCWLGEYWLVHRLVSLHFHGTIPRGIKVLHRCDTPRCWRPSHLFRGTDKDNSDDKFSKGRFVPMPGSLNGEAKLTEVDIPCIRQRIANGETYRVVANDYGVSIPAVFKVFKRLTWTHVA